MPPGFDVVSASTEKRNGRGRVQEKQKVDLAMEQAWSGAASGRDSLEAEGSPGVARSPTGAAVGEEKWRPWTLCEKDAKKRGPNK